MKDELKALVLYRQEQADESLASAELLYNNQQYRPAVNRAYYAMFYILLALFAAEKQIASKHTGVISIFDREYVKKGIFNKNLSKWIHEAFDLRQRADYTEMFTISNERAFEVIETAKKFVNMINNNISIKMNNMID